MPEKYISARMSACLKQFWGYEQFRPWQEDTIFSVLDERDSLTVLPTGGGKSLCFQLPALLKEGMAVVISPLISLMKDQVDGLKDMGISAEYLNSSQPAQEQREVIACIRERRIKLLYISPERLRTEWTANLLKSVPLSFFVVDEAHCISHWGHDFREDYRGLGIIKENFASVNIHAFTATATKEVQSDILGQLRLNNPYINIASVDRPNLTYGFGYMESQTIALPAYRVMPRTNLITQLTEVLRRHRYEAGIIYCLRRDDVDRICVRLNDLGFKNLPYHAGLSDDERHANQESFIREEVNIIVATVAFGMGIDRPDIRFIIHAAMPKSIEHYHQETGRAGRDSLSSYCYMFYGGGDFRVWSFFSEQSPNKDVMMDKLKAMYNFCSQPQCRHKVLVNYFSQNYTGGNCQLCDYCLGEVETVDEPLKIGQKILACAESVTYGDGKGFGVGYIADVLKGNLTDQITSWRHQHSQSFGAMANESLLFIRYMIEQLIGQGFLKRKGEYATLSLTGSGRRLLRGEVTPILAKPLLAKKKKEISGRQREKRIRDWTGGFGYGKPNHGLLACVDEELFELLRRRRAALAFTQGVPAYIIFGDRSLKDMAALKPLTRQAFATVFGVGEHKLKTYSEAFISVIKQYLARKSPSAITLSEILHFVQNRPSP